MKEICGYIAVVLSAAAYAPYIISIIRRKTKPHLLSWIVWTVATAIAFAAQIINGAGPGSWMTGITTVANCIILIMAIFCGEKNITLSDWISFVLALGAISSWCFAKDPLGAVTLSCLIEIFGSYPTFRKTRINPKSESAAFWILLLVRAIIGLIAIEKYSLLTDLYPISIILINVVMVYQIMGRRSEEADV